ncbi:hypothetical protein ANCCAN_05496 [Ancylostoma caninum]|uniref:G-protein coupled receptors family 1 profile domain-containing protein n=1 Tax=Ancylostoma caninum TaxID=29170 RepID=A0A368GZS6_ANCCA|nr:hypothetical protein ANCCAN_05496 [Ancylostoma caninum]
MPNQQLVTPHSYEAIVEIQDGYVIDTYVYLPGHCISFVCMLVMLTSLLMNRHMQSRPRKMFAFSCASFLLAATYNILSDFLYLAMIHKKISIQNCSVLRNFVLNPLAVQAVVDAVDRFTVIFGYGTMETVVYVFYVTAREF